MIVIEFNSGSKQITKAFRKRGHKVLSIDINPALNPDLVMDMLKFKVSMLPKKFRKPDVAWFSPPCTRFSVCTISRHFKDGKPKTSECYMALALAIKCLEIIKELKPRYWFIENPRGMLRKQHFMPNGLRKTVTYCQYGDKDQKPTDIWTNNVSWIPRKACNAGDSCHEYQPRRYKSKLRHGVVGLGVQGLANAYERGKIPKQLCEEIVIACEGNQKIKQQVLTTKRVTPLCL